MSNTLTQATILATRQWFADNALACMAKAEDGSVKVNNIESYCAAMRGRREDVLAGKNDHTFTFQQRGWYIQTGDCIAFLQ